MDKEELLAKLKSIVTPYTQDTAALANISPETDFINDLKINSANLVDVVLDVEDEFNIEIDNQEMARMLNVATTVEIIEAKLKTVGR
jgi:acyl carrier protein